MRKRNMIAGLFLLGLSLPVFGQFTQEEVAEREYWEEFLRKAKVVKSRQLDVSEAVTSPWVLTLERDGVTRKALWKNPEGFQNGYVEGWEWEIAAYRLDKYLGLNMVPPTVEKRVWGERGSCQLWIESEMSLKKKNREKIATPQYVVRNWNRAMGLQRGFDNLIANEDRHQGNYLITKDWRIILIDHSRTFRVSKEFTQKLIFTEDHPDGDLSMRWMSRSFVERIKTLNEDAIKEAVGRYLTGKERRAVLTRRDLILQEIDKIIAKYGEEEVLYD